MPGDGTMRIRSYRVCFRLERRIHRIDRWRIPVPYGIPLRGIAYGAGGLAVVLLLSGMPLVGELLRLLHPALRLVVLPVGAAYLLTQLSIDGRPAHAAALAWLRLHVQPVRMASGRALPAARVEFVAPVAIAVDQRAARLRPAVVRGPAVVLLRYPARARIRGQTLRLTQSSERPMWRGRRIDLRAGQRLRVR
jgi:hypothetical protein